MGGANNPYETHPHTKFRVHMLKQYCMMQKDDEIHVEISTEDTGKELIIHVPSKPKQYYYIKNHAGYVMALNGNIDRPDQQLAGTHVVLKEKLLDKTIAQSQLWYLEDAGDAGLYCYIVSKQNGFVLDIEQAQWAMGTPIILWPKNTPPTVIANQKWKINRKEGVIVSQLNGQVLEIQKPERVGSRIIMMKRKGQLEDASLQQWEFEPV